MENSFQEIVTDAERALEISFHAIRKITSFSPELAIVLGSGMGSFFDVIHVEEKISFREIPGIPVTTVPGHEGNFIFGDLKGIPVAVQQGRLHLYEGYTPVQAVHPLRLLRMMGAGTLFLTNSAGGIQKGMSPGDLMLIEDQISFLVPSPLRGPNCGTLGPRFPDMSEIYDRELRRKITDAAAAAGIPLKHGVYAQTPGPAFESPAEIRMLLKAGADAVGMSTAIEAIAARHCGMRVCGISSISNLACGLSDRALSIEEVFDVSQKTAPLVRKLIRTAAGAILES